MSQTLPEAPFNATNHSPPPVGSSWALAQLPRSSIALASSLRGGSSFVNGGRHAACLAFASSSTFFLLRLIVRLPMFTRILRSYRHHDLQLGRLSPHQTPVHRDVRSRPIRLKRERWGVIRYVAHVSYHVSLIFLIKIPIKSCYRSATFTLANRFTALDVA